MEKKNLKWYEAPQVEVVEMELEAAVLTASDGTPDNEGWREKD